MIDWFLTLRGDTFTAFGFSHIFMLILYIICVFLLLLFHREIKTNTKIFQRIRWFLFVLLVGSEIIYQTWTAFHGIWVYHLPFHLCGVASLVGAIALFTLNRKLMVTTFFIGFIPAFLALITPELPYDFPNFRYFKFFIHHIAISTTSVFIAVTAKPGTITFKNMLHTYTILIIYALYVGFIINPWLEANYLYLSSPPIVATPLDWFGNGIWYRINLGLVAFIVFLLQFLTFRWLKKREYI